MPRCWWVAPNAPLSVGGTECPGVGGWHQCPGVGGPPSPKRATERQCWWVAPTPLCRWVAPNAPVLVARLRPRGLRNAGAGGWHQMPRCRWVSVGGWHQLPCVGGWHRMPRCRWVAPLPTFTWWVGRPGGPEGAAAQSPGLPAPGNGIPPRTRPEGTPEQDAGRIPSRWAVPGFSSRRQEDRNGRGGFVPWSEIPPRPSRTLTVLWGDPGLKPRPLFGRTFGTLWW